MKTPAKIMETRLNFDGFSIDEIEVITELWKRGKEVLKKIQSVSITQAILDDVENGREASIVRRTMKYQNELMAKIYDLNSNNNAVEISKKSRNDK